MIKIRVIFVLELSRRVLASVLYLNLFLFLFLGLAAFTLYGRLKAPFALPARAVLPLSGLYIAIDPGHGGYDPGAKSNDILEKDIVLEISLYLREYMQQGGARVMMTREEDRDFLLPAAGPKKRQDLHNRLKSVEEAGVDLLLSIHANHFPSPYWSGSQVFYQEGCSKGEALAAAIQAELRRVLQNTERQAKSGDFFMLRESSVPGVVVEVGFLSHPGEAALLASPAYQKKLAWAVYLGVVAFINAT